LADAASGIGYGAIFGTEYSHSLWRDEWRLADLLSSFQVQTFQRETSASMNSCATDIPQALLPQN
jgi:hypothetical protein